MKTKFLSKLITEHLVDNRYVKLYLPFKYYSHILKRVVEIPGDFICDFESVPIVKGSSKRAGVGHDYFCRKDSIPIVSKQVAADLYFELQECKDHGRVPKYGFMSTFPWFIKRHFKTVVVRVTPFYFHKLKVMATLDEMD